tara:strand:+ start:368 stop:778 length:411 start_codon:yes stop_codon:yes gene_type:complete
MVECNRGCGTQALHWKVVNNKYKLFNKNDLLHICNDGELASVKVMETATGKILNELGLREPANIPLPEHIHTEDDKIVSYKEKPLYDVKANGDPKKMFTITTTSNGIAVTGDDKHNAIYLPKIAVPELIKALIDFI